MRGTLPRKTRVGVDWKRFQSLGILSCVALKIKDSPNAHGNLND